MAVIHVSLIPGWLTAQYIVFPKQPTKCGETPRYPQKPTLFCEELTGHQGPHHAWSADGSAWEWHTS